MGNRNIVNGLALIGAIIVIIGVTFAANSALADEASVSRASTPAPAAALETTRAKAKAGNRQAADAASDRIAAATRLDLEIRLADRRSTTVSRNR